MILPSMWREELLHPMTVHFPIVLILIGGSCWVLGWALRPWRDFLFRTGAFLLFLAAPLSWLSVYTGDLAHDAVSRTLCDPFVMHDHEDWAEYSAFLASGIALLIIVASLKKVRGFWRQALHITITLAACVNIALLGYVSHLGATLVYQQGAAVHKPSPQCEGF